jgi:enoyl-[acyl-carrier-protein] reductase (NADH)
MSRASEDQMAALHGKVAETMITALDQADVAARLVVKYRDEDLPSDIKRFIEDASEVNPSLLTSVIKFLKDNNISCDVEEDADLEELQSKLKEKRNNVSKIGFTD